MANDEQLRAMVSRMKSRGDTDDAIAEVVRNYDAMKPPASHDTTKAPETMSDLMDAALRSKGIERTPEQREMANTMAEGALSGGVSSAAPTVVGQAAQAFAPGISRALKGGAERLYGGLLKAKDATVERFPNVVKDLIAARAPISQGGRRQVIEGLRRVGAEKDVLLKGADERAMVPRETLRRGLDNSLDDAITHSDKPVKDMERLAKVERDLIPDEPGVLPSRADKIKTTLQRESDRGFRAAKMGLKVNDTAARAKMAVSNEAKEALEAIEPKLKDVNARYGSGKGQAEALRDALKRSEKHGIISMNDLIGAGVGSAVGGPGGGAAGAALMKLLSHPHSGSRAAILMDRAGSVPHLDQAMKAAMLSLLSQEE